MHKSSEPAPTGLTTPVLRAAAARPTGATGRGPHLVSPPRRSARCLPATVRWGPPPPHRSCHALKVRAPTTILSANVRIDGPSHRPRPVAVGWLTTGVPESLERNPGGGVGSGL